MQISLQIQSRKKLNFQNSLLKNKMSFVELGEDYANSNNREKAIRSLRKTAEKFGFSLISKTNE
jgi:FAD synthase